MAMLSVSVDVARAATQTAAATGPVVKVGIMTPITSATAANPDTGDSFLAAIAAFNKRGGVGTNHSRLKGVVCDTKGDVNGEVDCARKMVDEGVVATLGDLTYNNPGGVVDVMEGAHIPRIGLGEAGLPEFGSTVSYPVSAGIVGGYVGTAVGFNDDGKKKVTLVRTDAPTGASFKGFIAPPFEKVGLDVVGDVALATGSTDYAPYVAQIQDTGANSVLLAIDDAAAAQLIAAMSQLNAKIVMGGVPGTFTVDTLRKFKTLTKGTILADSFPYPSVNNAKRFPGLRNYFADMKASGKGNLETKNLQPSSFSPWIATLAFVNLTKNLDSITKDTVVQALKTEKDVDLDGLAPPWTPSTPGFSLFSSVSNHFVFVSRFDGKNVVTEKKPIDISQYLSS